MSFFKDERHEVEALAAELEQLVDEYPMGGDGRGAVMVTLTGGLGHPRLTVELRLEESAAIRQALVRLRQNFKQQHPDQPGICAHCHGQGRADESRECPNCQERMRWWQSPDLPADQAQELGWWVCEGCAHRVAGPYGAEQADAGARSELQPGHADGQHWRCVACETVNAITDRTCMACDRGRPQLVAGHRQYTITCPYCSSTDVEEYGEPIPTTHDDYADCARCRACGREWGLDPAADASCTSCGGSGRPGNGPHFRRDEQGVRMLTPACSCSEEP
ncbi:hypothetical protein ACFV1W_30365 [Kitasatospora sp. NPDC059648]|uniref:hypothetical protein n=1 Tax=Kitasatospora sp. NPDC059648 TaxID=3346894 RepID=UPI0036B512E6